MIITVWLELAPSPPPAASSCTCSIGIKIERIKTWRNERHLFVRSYGDEGEDANDNRSRGHLY
jgi:hypothetical protein